MLVEGDMSKLNGSTAKQYARCIKPCLKSRADESY